MDVSPLVSVIVPIFNVEEYLPLCLSSLQKQIYKNIEFILVDDGSTDHCMTICEEYAGKDKRFKLIHQENGGLSAARNTGIDHANGQYLGFVDGDDWISENMYQSLIDAMQQYNAEIAACQFQYVYSGGRMRTEPSHFFCVSGQRAVELLLRGEQIQDYVCNKLFSAELFQSIRYPVGRVFEDIGTTYRLFLEAARVVSIPEAHYYYLQRATGIVQSISLKKEIDCYYAHYWRYVDLAVSYHELVPDMLARIGHAASKVWSSACQEPRKEQKRYAKELCEISTFIRRHYPVIRQHTAMGITGRLSLSLVRINHLWSYWTCGVLNRLYQWKHISS